MIANGLQINSAASPTSIDSFPSSPLNCSSNPVKEQFSSPGLTVRRRGFSQQLQTNRLLFKKGMHKRFVLKWNAVREVLSLEKV